MVMEISFSTMFFHDHPLGTIFDAVRRSGADTLEFWPETPDWWLDALPMVRLKQVITNHPFSTPISIHTPVLDLNPCSINPDVVKVSIAWIGYSIRLAESIGAAVCTIHPGRRTSKRQPTKIDYHRLNNMLDAIAPLAQESSVKVSIENMEPQVNALLSTPDEISSILNEREWLSFTLDTCHVSSQGEEVLKDFLSITEDRLVNIHFSGAEGGVLHLPAKGNHWAETAIKTLSNTGYHGLITLEINDLSVIRPLSIEEKITILTDDVSYIRDRLT